MIYLSRNEHGGGCCGVEHLWGFPNYDEGSFSFKDKVEALQQQLNLENGGETLEVVLTRQQAKIWERALQRCGFKRVMEFNNPNTGNILRMYLSTNNQVKPNPKPRKGDK